MRLKFFTIPVFEAEDAEQVLNRFLAAHRILAVDSQFIADGINSVWAISVHYEQGGERPAPIKRGKVDYKELLSEQDFIVYSRLRELRKQLAQQEGVPVYALFTNEQMAAIVQQRVASLAQLQAIEGVGEGRVGKYGKAFLNLLQSALSEGPGTSGDRDEA